MSKRYCFWVLLLGMFLCPSAAWAQVSRVKATEDLLELMRQAVQRQYQIPAHDVLILWNDEELEKKLARMGSGLSAEIPESELRNLTQRQTLMLKVMAGEAYKGRVPIRFRVDGWVETYQAAEVLSKGQALSEKGLKPVRMKLSALPSHFVRTPFRFEDFAPRQDIPAGTVLQQGLLQERLLVQRGQSVKVIVVNENLRLVAQGEALETGARSAWVRVKILNFGSQQIVRALVSNDGEVILDIGS